VISGLGEFPGYVHDYKLAFAALAVPAVIILSLVLVARRFFPRPQDLSAGPAEVTRGRSRHLVMAGGDESETCRQRAWDASESPVSPGPWSIAGSRRCLRLW
jgi:hypothetical protein